jgi:hypothetical protein
MREHYLVLKAMFLRSKMVKECIVDTPGSEERHPETWLYINRN